MPPSMWNQTPRKHTKRNNQIFVKHSHAYISSIIIQPPTQLSSNQNQRIRPNSISNASILPMAAPLPPFIIVWLTLVLVVIPPLWSLVFLICCLATITVPSATIVWVALLICVVFPCCTVFLVRYVAVWKSALGREYSDLIVSWWLRWRWVFRKSLLEEEGTWWVVRWTWYSVGLCLFRSWCALCFCVWSRVLMCLFEK